MKITKKDITYLVERVLKEMDDQNTDLPDGVYIQLRNGDIITTDEYKRMGKQRTRGVLVKSGGHEFVIFKEDAEKRLTWADAVGQYDMWSKEEAEQVAILKKEINKSLSVIGGTLLYDLYWTSTKHDMYDNSWAYDGYSGVSLFDPEASLTIRPIGHIK